MPGLSLGGGKPSGIQSKGFNLNLGSVKREIDEEPSEPPLVKRETAKPKMGAIPGLNLGSMPAYNYGVDPTKEASRTAEEAPPKKPSTEVSSGPAAAASKPKLGLGLNIKKATDLQQENLVLHEEKRMQARRIGEQAKGVAQTGLNLGDAQRNSNNTPDQPSSDRVSGGPAQGQLSSDRQEYPTPSSQGQGESYRDGSLNGIDSRAAKIENMQIAPEQLNDEDFDYKGTSRKEYENEYFKRICSEIIDNFMYLGGDLIARDADTFKQVGITHVVNCVGDYSPNYHEEAGVKYLRFYLKDHVGEDIACIFYDALHFIQECRN